MDWMKTRRMNSFLELHAVVPPKGDSPTPRREVLVEN